jgi:hypothetical protein
MRTRPPSVPLAWTAALLAAAAATGGEPVKMADQADRQILAAFLVNTDRSLARVTEANVAKITQGEDITWVWARYVRLPLIAYRLTGNAKHLDRFGESMDTLLTRLRKGPDGYMGFRGLPLPLFRDPQRPDAQVDVVITAFSVTHVICEFAEVLAAEPALKATHKARLERYLKLATEHLVAKWDARGQFRDLGPKGAVYVTGAVGRPTKRDLTQPNNKQSICCQALLALYRVTGKAAYFRKAVQLGIRFKHTLRLAEGGYRWHYWDPAGPWDRREDDPKRWKHWIGAEHRGGYHGLTIAMAEALYDHGVVFDRTDMARFVRTQMRVCWNGSFDRPVFRRVDGGKPQRGGYMPAALARFEPKIHRFLYERNGPKERLANRNHSWQGGVVAGGYLLGKYLSPAATEPTRTEYRRRFAADPANARWLKSIEFHITP